MDFHSMKRRELQALCKEHKIRANLTNLEMADRLSSLFKSSLINSAEKLSESDSDIAEKRLMKARFSSENENKRIETHESKISAEVFKDKSVVADGGITQPEMGLRRSKRIADKHVNGPIMAVPNANKRKSTMPNIKKAIIGIPVADEEEFEDNHQKRLESIPKSFLKKQTSVYIELSDSKKVGNSVIKGNEELQIKELPLALSVTGVVDTMALGIEELQAEESPLSAYVVSDNSVIATVNGDILCCQTPLKGSDGIEHGMPTSMGETCRKVGDEQESQEVIGAKEWKSMFSKDFEVFEKEMIAVHSENTSSSVKGMDGHKDQNGEQIVSSAVLKEDDCGKDTNDSHQFMEAVPQWVMLFGETDCHLKEVVQGMDEKDFLVQGVDEVNKVKDVEATRNGINAASGVPTEVLLVNEDGMEEDAAAKLLHGNETQTLTEETNEGHGSSDYFNDTFAEHHAEQKLCLQHEQIEASKSTLADTGAEIFEGIMSVREDSVYNDSVGVGCQERREEDMNFSETDCHLKEVVQGMDEKDLLVQKVVDVIKVKDVEATEVLLINEDGMEEDADTKLLHGSEIQTSIVENNEAHGSSDYFDDSSKEYHSNQKLCLQHECIKVSNTTLAHRGAEIFDGIMSTGKDPVYNDTVDVGYQESTGKATAVEETTKTDFEGNLCMGGAHHDLDGQLSLAGEEGTEITCSNSGGVKEIRTHETSIGETSSPIIFEQTNIDIAGIMCSASAGLSATVSDYGLHCQTPLKGSDESEQGMAMSLDETSRKVGEEEEPQEVIEAKENDVACLFKVNVKQNTEEEVFSPGSVESEKENQLRMLFGTPDTFSTCCNEKNSPSNDAENAEGTAFRSKDSDVECLFKFNSLQNTEKETTSPSSMESEQEDLLKILFVTPDTKSTSLSEQQTSSQAVEISAVSMSSENNLKKSILGRFSHGKSLEVVELKEREVNERSALKSKGEEITGKGSNSIDEEIASPGPLGFIKVMFEDGNEPVKGNMKTPFVDLLEEGGGCIEISGKVMAEILGDDVSKADDCGKDTNDSCPFVETVPQFDMTICETDRHLKELFLGMDDRDFLVQGVVDIMKVKDMEAARHGIDATEGKHFDLGGEASGIPTEELLRHEDAMKEDAPAKLLHFSLPNLNDSSEHGDTEFTVDSDMLSSELKFFGRADEVEGDKSNAWSRKNNFVIENSEDAGENSEASETKLRMADQPPAYDNFASDKDVWKGQLERDIVETKDSEAISEGKIPVRHPFSTILTQKTPSKSIMTADMKENAQSFKRQPGSYIAAKSTKKRRALEEL